MQCPPTHSNNVHLLTVNKVQIQIIIEKTESGSDQGLREIVRGGGRACENPVFLDFQKALYAINHNFLYATLEKNNFSNSFIKWVKTIYNNAEACLSNNGWTSRPLGIQRGIRQGCPLSALLFLLVVEILGNQIRKNTNDGLEVKLKNENKYIYFTQLEDATSVFLKNEQAIKNCLKVIKEFGRVTGLKLNMEKKQKVCG